MSTIRFKIVTPTFNSAKYLDDTIYSVVSQSGDFHIEYHLQDGGSNDATLEMARAWQTLVRDGQIPLQCASISFSITQANDSGMYDALNRGFDALIPTDDCVMTWINSDDRLAPGALSAIAALLSDLPTTQWITGRVSMLNERGAVLGVNLPIGFAQDALAAGKHDGRTLQFVMQEGTFWRGSLWRKVGGLDPKFRLAGDWDLWRRMARYAPLVTIDTITGFHRRRPGQLSEAMDRYYAEVDATLEQATQSETLPCTKRVASYELTTKSWIAIDQYGEPPLATNRIDALSLRSPIPVHVTSGTRPPEGPYPAWSLPAGIRWIIEPVAEARITPPRAGRYRLTLVCRAAHAGVTLSVKQRGLVLWSGTIPHAAQSRNEALELTVWLHEGVNTLEMGVGSHLAAGAPRLLIIEYYATEDSARPSMRPAPSISAWAQRWNDAGGALPRISIVVPTYNQGPFIEQTLQSLIHQHYPNLEIIVIDGGSTDETLSILRAYHEHISYVVSEPDRGQSHAINKGFQRATGTILGWLNSDDMLAPGALHAIAFSFSQSNADIVAGGCAVFDETQRFSHTHYPACKSAQLNAHDVLDIEAQWLQGKFFHQPEVFFTRDLYERAGGHVSESLHYSMDYDLWVRFAHAGAEIKVIGEVIAYFRTHPAQKTSSVAAYAPELHQHSEFLRAKFSLPRAISRATTKRSLRIVLFNDYGPKYGAGLAQHRLAQALSAAGHHIVQLGLADFDLSPGAFMAADEALAKIRSHDPDLVVVGNLHFISADYELLDALITARIPTIFVAHDRWIMTGRCAYPGECRQFLTHCTNECPTANSYPRLERARIPKAHATKKRLLELARDRQVPFAVFANSRATKSQIQLVCDDSDVAHAIQLGVDTNTFTPLPQWSARQLLDLPHDRIVIATAAANISDPRKGLDLLLAAAELLSQPVTIVSIGGGLQPTVSSNTQFISMGFVQDERFLANVYSAADIFVGPSREEALGQTFIEASACGIPSVAFAVGGIPEIVIDGVTGLLAHSVDPVALAACIEKLINDRELRRRLGANALLHSRTNYSMAASVQSFVSVLADLPGFGELELAPTIVLGANHEPTFTARYLCDDGSDISPLNIESGAVIVAGKRSHREIRPVPEALLAAPYYWLEGPHSTIFVYFDRPPAESRIAFHLRPTTTQLLCLVKANGSEERLMSLDGTASQSMRVEIELAIFEGWNRLDFEFDRWVDDEYHRSPAVLLERIVPKRWDAIDQASEEIVAPAAPQELLQSDGDFVHLDGFSFWEGPYPEHGLHKPFRWSLGTLSSLQLFSQNSGPRTLTCVISSPTADQVLRLNIDGQELGRSLPFGGNLDDVYHLSLPFQARAGVIRIDIELSKVVETDDGRPLGIIVRELLLDASSDDLSQRGEDVRDRRGHHHLASAALSNEPRQLVSQLPASIRRLGEHPRLNRARALLAPRVVTKNHYPPRSISLSSNSPTPRWDAPRVSIAIAATNASRCVDGTLESIAQQNYPNLEVLVRSFENSDACDTRAPAASEWRESDQGVQRIRLLNRALTASDGEIMGALSSEDRLLPGALSTVGNYFADHPEVDVVYGHRVILDRDGKQIGRWILPEHDNTMPSWRNYAPGESFFWRKRVWHRIGGYLDENFDLLADWDLLLRFQSAGAVVRRIPRILGARHFLEEDSYNVVSESERILMRTHGHVPSEYQIREGLKGYHTRQVISHYQFALLEYASNGISRLMEKMRRR